MKLNSVRTNIYVTVSKKCWYIPTNYLNNIKICKLTALLVYHKLEDEIRYKK